MDTSSNKKQVNLRTFHHHQKEKVEKHKGQQSFHGSILVQGRVKEEGLDNRKTV